MTTRFLPPAQWSRLSDTPTAPLVPALDARHHSVIVVERGETIVGCVVLMQVLHAECLWIAPEYQGRVSVARRLWSWTIAATQRFGFPTLWMAALDKRMAGIVCGLGAVRVQADSYLLTVKELETCRQP